MFPGRRGVSAALAASLTLALAAGACTSAAPQPPSAEDRASPGRSPGPRPRRGDGAGAPNPAGCAVPASYPRPDPDRPRYRLHVRLAVPRHVVWGRVAVRFTPDLATDRLVFRLWPNGPHQAAEGAALRTIGPVTSAGRSLRSRLTDPTTLVVDPGGRLERGESISVALRWRLSVPGPVLDRIAGTAEWMRLGSFFPLLAWEPGRGWATDPPTTALAETSTSATADFDVTVAGVPQGARVLSSGRRVGPGRWRAAAVRDFAMAVGPFAIARRIVPATEPVAVTVGTTEGRGPSPAAFADKVAGALEDLAARYGPYPWDALSLAVLPGLGRAGIEYPTMIFEGPESLDWATTHEVAHSWFYALVGNNQARDPWLDEGLASWAQARVDGLVRWFVEYPIPDVARGHLGAPMPYWQGRENTYFGGVYAGGVKALAALGPPARVDCALRGYVARNAYAIAEPRDLARALERVLPRARRVLDRFGARL